MLSSLTKSLSEATSRIFRRAFRWIKRIVRLALLFALAKAKWLGNRMWGNARPFVAPPFEWVWRHTARPRNWLLEKSIALRSRAIKIATPRIEKLKTKVREEYYPWAKPHLQKAYQLIMPPYNLPLLVGFVFLGLGMLFIVGSIKKPWYQIPVHLDPAPIVDQSDVLPTKRVPREMVATMRDSRFEAPCKAIIVISILTAGIYIVRNKVAALPRAQALGTVSAITLTVGLAFAHLVIVDEPELSHQATWFYAQHDALYWYGGDIYTSREYEVPGGGFDILVKEPRKFLGTVSPPYFDLDLATINDFLTWAGLCHSFWVFMGKGWAMGMMGSLLLLIGVLCTRKPGQTRGLSNDIVVWVMIRGCMILVPWVLIITGRALLVANTVAAAHLAYEKGDLVESLEHMQGYRRYMPCLEYDSGLMIQEGILEMTLGRETERAKLAEAFLLANNGDPVKSEKLFFSLMDSPEPCVAREATRFIFRRACIAYNAGSEEHCLQLLDNVRGRYPCLPKVSYLRLLIAVRCNDFEVAQRSLQEIYAMVRSVGIPEARGYCTSGHQHLAQLAFDRGDVVETRRQAVYRAEQQHKIEKKK